MSFRNWVITFCLTCLMFGCRQANEVQVTFSVFGDPPELAAYQSLVDAFEAKHPEIKIALRHIPSQSEYRRRLATDFSSGDPTDVFLLNYRRFAPFANQGSLEPLGPYLEKSDLIQADDFFPNTIDSFTYQDTLWCIPQNISSLVVYYNRDLFDAAGLAYPQDDWSRADFLDLARALTQDTDGDGTIDQYGASLAPSIFRLAPFVWQDGADIVDNLAQPTRLTLTDPVPLATLTWFVNLQVVEKVVPDAVAETSEEGEARFLNGRLGMYFNSRRGVPTYRTITNFAWDVVPLPQSENAASILHSDAYCMAAATENKAAAWTFIEFANAVEGQTLIAASGRTVPSLISVAESPAFLSPDQAPANSRVFIDTVPTLGHVPLMATWAAIEDTASKEIERAFYGQVSVEEAAETAVKETQTYFDQNSP